MSAVVAVAMAQSHYVPGHQAKSGKYVPGHWVKDRNTTGPKLPQPHTGEHREHRFYEGHYDKNGNWIKPHSRWVWVKD